MANRYSRKNVSSKAAEDREYQDYEERRGRMSILAKIIVILVAAAMIITTFLASGVFFLN